MNFYKLGKIKNIVFLREEMNAWLILLITYEVIGFYGMIALAYGSLSTSWKGAKFIYKTNESVVKKNKNKENEEDDDTWLIIEKSFI